MTVGEWIAETASAWFRQVVGSGTMILVCTSPFLALGLATVGATQDSRRVTAIGRPAFLALLVPAHPTPAVVPGPTGARLAGARRLLRASFCRVRSRHRAHPSLVGRLRRLVGAVVVVLRRRTDVPAAVLATARTARLGRTRASHRACSRWAGWSGSRDSRSRRPVIPSRDRFRVARARGAPGVPRTPPLPHHDGMRRPDSHPPRIPREGGAAAPGAGDAGHRRRGAGPRCRARLRPGRGARYA